MERWYGATRWSTADVIAAAEENGVGMTEEQAVAWWMKNEEIFKDQMVELGNEVLSMMDY